MTFYEVTFGGIIELKKAKEGGFNIWVNGEESDWKDNEQDAIEEAATYIISDDLIIKGYGTHSGRKFWQLPESIQDEVIKMANK